MRVVWNLIWQLLWPLNRLVLCASVVCLLAAIIFSRGQSVNPSVAVQAPKLSAPDVSKPQKPVLRAVRSTEAKEVKVSGTTPSFESVEPKEKIYGGTSDPLEPEVKVLIKDRVEQAIRESRSAHKDLPLKWFLFHADRQFRTDVSAHPIFASGTVRFMTGKFQSTIEPMNFVACFDGAPPYRLELLRIDDQLAYEYDKDALSAPKTNELRQPVRSVRTFKSASGDFQVEAVFLSMSNGRARLKKNDGREIVVDLADLSADDVKWIRDGAYRK